MFTFDCPNKLRMRFLINLLLLLFTFSLVAQVQEEVNPPYNIKTIIFKGPTEDQFPIIQLGEEINLEFDDITASEQDYYFKIVHCDYDWTPSKLLKSQYLSGTDNQRIVDYENSFSTLQPYSNYKLTLPNSQLSFRVGGNYLIEIYNAKNELQFSRRFIIYQNSVQVGAIVRRSRDFNYLLEKQVVQFSIETSGFPVVNPKKEVKVAIIQNYFWPTAITNIAPQFTMGTQLIYKYDQETSFYGGNEFLNFDTKDLRAPTAAISKIDFKELYNHYLFTNSYRNDEEYTYFPDINGDFSINTLQGEDASRESEYTKVHFSLPYDPSLGFDNVYVFGKFNNYSIEEDNRMVYNEDTGNLELMHPFKQGFYNYKYVTEDEEGIIDLNTVSGNFHFTENNYLILVYYRNFGDMYDSLIGIGNANSRNITN